MHHEAILDGRQVAAVTLARLMEPFPLEWAALLSRNDVRIIVTAQLLRQLSRSPTLDSALHLLDSANCDTEALIDRIRGGQAIAFRRNKLGEVRKTFLRSTGRGFTS